VTSKTTKEELVERLRKASAAIRRTDRAKKAKLQEVEDRLRAKGTVNKDELLQVVVSSTEAEWKQTVAFLEEFEHEGLLPTPLQRLAIGGRVLLGQIDAAG
jgi:hypothetical protein